MKLLANNVDTHLKKNHQMETLSDKQMDDFQSATVCHICKKFLTNNDKVRDHNHLTGKYRGAAHNSCNLLYRDSHTIPIVFHNLSGYDAHFIIRSIATSFEGDVKIPPVNKDRYISFTKYVANTCIKLRFIDSFRFMGSSLEKLASYLDNDHKIIIRKYQSDSTRFNLLCRKGVFPYEFIDDWNKLDEAELPRKEDFYSKLTDQHIADEDYEHAVNVWNAFNISTLGEYSDLYLQTDVLLLADIFENFRANCFSTYELDPLHYYTAPGLAFDAMLKHTKVNLELLTDSEMILFIEKGIRGGVSQCANRYAQVNNPFMGKLYDASSETSYLMYFDVNNFYGAAMSVSLPCDSFEWVDSNSVDILNVPDDSPVGYILEIDLEYPQELHEQHKDFPLCPEHFTPPQSKHTKLATTLFPKEKYVIHYRNLKQYMNLGMKLKSIHSNLKFNQKLWLKSYIDLNTDKRKQSSNEFEKNFYKLMNNAVFGKTMENVRNQKDVRLVTHWDGRYGAKALIAKPNFHSCSVFDEDMVIIEMNRTSVYFKKPIYIGFTILDVSKTIVYDFHYNYVKSKFGDHAKLMYTDTDSLLYLFRVPNIYDCIKQDIQMFDTSDYRENNEFGIPLANKKVLGLMKDENNGRIMVEFVGLRAKTYSFKMLDDDKAKKKAKGVNAATLRKITFEDYKNCLLNNEHIIRNQYLIQSKKHEVHTISQKKLVLSWEDDKRMISSHTTDTLPWGYIKPLV
ncbi:uncharacterized protein LOC107045547 [Diachasma alloeum]|uniref:uncharacterized protein LOC107045547 n=1 Tax=Diachasma alloeum TaxID=454923 RepID=UPI00073822D7|nr:uncharacterized protein LOC107045547 [Diachasma alloeum]